MTDYTLRIKDLCDSLGSINVAVDDDEMVHIYLGGLARKYGSFRTAITIIENPPRFFDLQSMLMVEENHTQSKSTASDGQMLYTHDDLGRGHGHGHGN